MNKKRLLTILATLLALFLLAATALAGDGEDHGSIDTASIDIDAPQMSPEIQEIIQERIESLMRKNSGLDVEQEEEVLVFSDGTVLYGTIEQCEIVD